METRQSLVPMIRRSSSKLGGTEPCRQIHEGGQGEVPAKGEQFLRLISARSEASI